MSFFSKTNYITIDARRDRPEPGDLDAKRQLIREIYAKQNTSGGWNARDHKIVCEKLGLPVKKAEDYTEQELDRFLKWLEDGRMILFKE